MSDEYRKLGMDRAITRRDFMNGVAVGITGASAALDVLPAFAENSPATPQAAAAASDSDAANYPPLRQGLRGNLPSAVDIFNPIRDGKYVQFPVADSEITEEMTVIVGGGISGLSAAHFYRLGLGPKYKILILDNHDDFGGHAKRNEFHYDGKVFYGYGGTMGIATPFTATVPKRLSKSWASTFPRIQNSSIAPSSRITSFKAACSSTRNISAGTVSSPATAACPGPTS